jgi:hypothetical protein
MTTAVVLGGATAVWDELVAAQALCRFDVVVAVNHAGRDYDGPIDHWASYHAALLPKWIDERRNKGRSPAGTLWTATYHGQSLGRRVNLKFQTLEGTGGSSGFLGARIALRFAERVVLCGVPMDPAREHYDKAGAWKECERYRQTWVDGAASFTGRVRSMSGWTADLLGRPTAGWVGGVAQRGEPPFEASP